jgi:hypothetical protein
MARRREYGGPEETIFAPDWWHIGTVPDAYEHVFESRKNGSKKVRCVRWKTCKKTCTHREVHDRSLGCITKQPKCPDCDRVRGEDALLGATNCR